MDLLSCGILRLKYDLLAEIYGLLVLRLKYHVLGRTNSPHDLLSEIYGIYSQNVKSDLAGDHKKTKHPGSTGS